MSWMGVTLIPRKVDRKKIDGRLHRVLDAHCRQSDRVTQAEHVCECSWVRAQNAAWRRLQPEVDRLYRGLRKSNALKRYHSYQELFNQAIRAMIEHRSYGRPVKRCRTCGGSGRVTWDHFGHFDAFESNHGWRWTEVLSPRHRTPNMWPVPKEDLHEFEKKLGYNPAEKNGTPVSSLLGSDVDDEDLLPVRTCLDHDLVPDVSCLATPDGRWLQREARDAAEDLASWHGRVFEELRRHPRHYLVLVRFY